MKTNVGIVVDNYANSLNKDIESMKTYVKRIYGENAHYQTLLRENLSVMDVIRETYYLSNTLEVKAGTIDYFGGVFFYDGEQNSLRSHYSEYSFAGDSYRLNVALKEALKEKKEITSEDIFYYEGEAYLLYQTGIKKKKIGFLLNLDRYFAVEESFHTFFLDETGTVIADSGALWGEKLEKNEVKNLVNECSESTEYIVISAPIGETNLELTVVYYIGGILKLWKNREMLLLFILIPICTIVIFGILYRLMNQIFLQSVEHLLYRTTQMKNVETESHKQRYSEVPTQNIREFIVINEKVDEMIEEIENLQKEKYKKELEMNAAQLQYYQLQVNPHFFINCLTFISSLLDSRDINAVNEMIYALSKHFRYVFQKRTNWVTVEDEIQEINSYCQIYMMKGSMPILFQSRVDESVKTCKIPILCIQPFVENSIKHASRIGKVLSVMVTVRKIEEDGCNYLNIIVSDNGTGYPVEKLKELNREIDEFQYSSQHVGIDNVKYRIYLLYGKTAKIAFYNSADNEAITEMVLPIWDVDES